MRASKQVKHLYDDIGQRLQYVQKMIVCVLTKDGNFVICETKNIKDKDAMFFSEQLREEHS